VYQTLLFVESWFQTTRTKDLNINYPIKNKNWTTQAYTKDVLPLSHRDFEDIYHIAEKSKLTSIHLWGLKLNDSAN